jgi:hypothetical protein
MGANFRPTEEIALRRCRRDMLCSTNFPAWQRWANMFKRAIKDRIAEDAAHVAAVERADQTKGITPISWSHK